jgi:hypothetical protein
MLSPASTLKSTAQLAFANSSTNFDMQDHHMACSQLKMLEHCAAANHCTVLALRKLWLEQRLRCKS